MAPFQFVDVWILSVHINKYNVAGLVIASLASITLLASQFLIHDCSRIFDLKRYLLNIGMSDETVTESFLAKENEKEHFAELDYQEIGPMENTGLMKEKGAVENISVKSFLKIVVTDIDLLLIYVSSYIFMFMIMGGEILIPLVNYSILNWSMNTFLAYISIYGVLLAVLSTVLGKICTTNISLYITGLISIFSMIISFDLLPIIIVLDRNNIRDAVLMLGFILGCACMWFIECIALRAMLGKMLPPNIQSFAQALRYGIGRACMMSASLVTPLLMQNLISFSFILIALAFVLLCLFLLRGKSLINLKTQRNLKAID